MIDNSTDASAAPTLLGGVTKARWAPTERPQEYADEAVLHYVNGKVYLSLGQIQIPAVNPSESTLDSVEILPVARIVFSEATFHKVLDMMNRVAPKITNPTTDAGEE